MHHALIAKKLLLVLRSICINRRSFPSQSAQSSHTVIFTAQATNVLQQNFALKVWILKSSLQSNCRRLCVSLKKELFKPDNTKEEFADSCQGSPPKSKPCIKASGSSWWKSLAQDLQRTEFHTKHLSYLGFWDNTFSSKNCIYPYPFPAIQFCLLFIPLLTE